MQKHHKINLSPDYIIGNNIDFKQKISQIFLVQSAVRSQIGEFGVHIVIFAVLTFAFTSIIGNYSYAETNVLFIKNSKKVLNIFRVTCVIFVFLGTLVASGVAWNLADVFMSLMAIVNILVILKINPYHYVRKTINELFGNNYGLFLRFLAFQKFN